MHKGVLLLVKAENADEAENTVRNDFMEYHGDGKVWDWYVIGGRWSGTLNEKTEEFFKKADELFKELYPDSSFVSTKMVEEQTQKLKEIWVEMGGVGENPYFRDTYSNTGYSDDIRPLSECIDVVKKWTKDMEVEAEQFFEKLIEEREKDKKSTMSAYYANRYAECKYDEFSFESNVFDITNGTNNPEKALSEIEGWFVVVVDMHN